MLLPPPPPEPSAFVLKLPAYQTGISPAALPPAPDWTGRELRMPRPRLPQNYGSRFTYRGPECWVSPGTDTLLLIGLSVLAASTGGHVEWYPPEARNGLVRPPR